LKSLWKNYSVETKRIYNIIFEERDIENVRKDYFDNKWISKSELLRLIEHEEKSFIKEYDRLKQEYNDLLNSFNMNALANYSLLERKMQGKLK
jgi:hypothetical protein